MTMAFDVLCAYLRGYFFPEITDRVREHIKAGGQAPPAIPSTASAKSGLLAQSLASKTCDDVVQRESSFNFDFPESMSKQTPKTIKQSPPEAPSERPASQVGDTSLVDKILATPTPAGA